MEFRTPSLRRFLIPSDLVYLNFEISLCEASGFGLQELKDDLAGWSATHGFFQCGCDGDVNGDGEITPMDALCAFETYLEICPTSCEIACEDVCCDVNQDGECTPADALCIFQKYLGIPSCLDLPDLIQVEACIGAGFFTCFLPVCEDTSI